MTVGEGEGEMTRLAEERTELARERTVLAHIRTGFASFLFGIGLLGLFDTAVSRYFAVLFIAVGVVFLITSLVTYVRSRRRLKISLARLRRKGRASS